MSSSSEEESSGIVLQKMFQEKIITRPNEVIRKMKYHIFEKELEIAQKELRDLKKHKTNEKTDYILKTIKDIIKEETQNVFEISFSSIQKKLKDITCISQKMFQKNDEMITTLEEINNKIDLFSVLFGNSPNSNSSNLYEQSVSKIINKIESLRKKLRYVLERIRLDYPNYNFNFEPANYRDIDEKSFGSEGYLGEEIIIMPKYTNNIFEAAKCGCLTDVQGHVMNHRDNLKKRSKFQGWMAIHYAADYGHNDVVQYLISEKVDIESIDDYLSTPLFLAAKRGHINIVQFLVNKGANFITRDAYGNTPLHVAAAFGHYEIVKYLIKLGVRNIFINHAGQLASQIALESQNYYIYELLIKPYTIIF